MKGIQVKGRWKVGAKDLISNLRYGRAEGIMAMIHQQNMVDVMHGGNMQDKKHLNFQSNIYDAIVLKDKLLVSNNKMPVRLYNVGENNFEQLPKISFYDRKVNSEQFLTPLQFTSQGEIVIGAGKKFMSKYDLGKGSTMRYKSMEKKYISALEIVQGMVVSGTFTGEIQLMDLKSGEIVTSIRPHMDLVTRIKKVKEGEGYFVTVARKDNLTYLWDLRNMKEFVSCFEHPKYGNQRTGLDISENGEFIYLAGEKGQIFIHPLKQDLIESWVYPLELQKCVSALCCTQSALYCSVGQREFPLNGQPSQGGHLFKLSLP